MLFSLGIGGAYIVENDVLSNFSESKKTEEEQKEKKQIPQPDRITLNTMFFGDVYFGRYIDDWSQASDLKYAYPFSGPRYIWKRKL